MQPNPTDIAAARQAELREQARVHRCCGRGALRRLREQTACCA